MFGGIEKLFDLNGDGKLDGVEMAFAYYVMFGDEEEHGSDDLESDMDQQENEEE